MNMDIKEVLEVLKRHKDRDDLGSSVYEAIDTVVAELEKTSPTDEQIEQYALENILEDDSTEASIDMLIWIEGAKWMRDLIQERMAK